MAWTTPIDRVFNEKIFFFTFVGIIVGTTVFTLFSDSPVGNRETLKKLEPRGNGSNALYSLSSFSDPENWSTSDLKRWLRQVGPAFGESLLIIREISISRRTNCEMTW